MSDDTPKAKRGRPRKKPDYDRTEQIDVLLEKAVDLFGEPFDDRKERSKDAVQAAVRTCYRAQTGK